MACVCKANLHTVYWCVSLVTLLLLLAGHVATLACNYVLGGLPSGAQDGGSFGEELLAGGAVLCSALPLLVLLKCLVPEKAGTLCRAWLAVHITYSDDAAQHAVRVLYATQVQPLLDALGLAAPAASLETLDYWWWCLQGLVLMVLVHYLATSEWPFQEEELEVTEIVLVGDEGWTHILLGPPPCHGDHATPDLPPV